jgi:hypothetical protein
MRVRKALISILLIFLLVTAGCMSGGSSGSATRTETPTPSVTPSATEISETPTSPDSESALNDPDSNKEVRIESEWNQTVKITIRVVQIQNNETVHHETYELAPGKQKAVYNLSEAEPDGVEAFAVVVTAQNDTQRVSIETNACYGHAYAVIKNNGSLDVVYAIC